MKKTTAWLVIISGIFIVSVAFAEDIYTNTKDGRDIVLHDNGTWESIEKQEKVFKSNSKPDFRKVKWGMSKEEVRRIEKAKLLEEEKAFLSYEEELSGLNVYLYYIFADEKLVRTMYRINESHTNETDYITDYNRLKELLIKKYETPIDDHTVWKDDQYKDRPQKWGFAMSMGDLYYVSAWELGPTSIALSLSGDNFEIRHFLEYKSMEFAELEHNKDEAEVLDDL